MAALLFCHCNQGEFATPWAFKPNCETREAWAVRSNRWLLPPCPTLMEHNRKEAPG